MLTGSPSAPIVIPLAHPLARQSHFYPFCDTNEVLQDVRQLYDTGLSTP